MKPLLRRMIYIIDIIRHCTRNNQHGSLPFSRVFQSHCKPRKAGWRATRVDSRVVLLLNSEVAEPLPPNAG